MAILTGKDLSFARAVSALSYCNPFLPERIDYEREALGDDFVETEAVWNIREALDDERPNLSILRGRVEALIKSLRLGIRQGGAAEPEELMLYEDLVLHLLYHRYRRDFQDLVRLACEKGSAKEKVTFWDAFRRDAEDLLDIDGVQLPWQHPPSHIFSCAFQIRRAFHHTYSYIVGGSMPAARLRAAVWQSVFTHDMRRYFRSLYDRMDDFTTLITGESGTGKELVARAVGLSRYIPFDAQKQCFAEDFVGSFHALSISSLSPTLIESELFGHRKGAFTGAIEDRSGWLEVCGPLGTVFLDEIGDLESSIQVKLLRVLQTRTFQRLGDTESRHFPGKIIAATNRDLDAEISEGRFREDFYYRLCSDIIVTPSLREVLRDAPEELHNLVVHIARRVAPDEAEAIAGEVEDLIGEQLGPDYAWAGNFRELEQCVRNVVIRREYRPHRAGGVTSTDVLARALAECDLTADELVGLQCTVVYSQTKNYQEAARRLNLDHRTVKSKIDQELLARLTQGGGSR